MANTIPGDEPRTIRTPEKEAEFLDALAQTCNVTEACRISDIGRRSVYDWRDDDEQFAAKWLKALSVGADKLEDEAVRRAMVGVDKPVYQGGELVGFIREYSDTLLIFLLKGAKPKKFRENINLRTEQVGLEKYLQQMTPAELEVYCATSKMPERFNLEGPTEPPQTGAQ